MRLKGDYVGAQRSLEGDLCIMFAIDDDPEALQKLEATQGKELILEIKRYSEKRSLNANSYFWKLCDLIAQKLESDKDTIYKLQLKKYGVFDHYEVIEQGVDLFKSVYRFCDEDYRYIAESQTADGEQTQITMVALKCYKGSHSYSKTEFAVLLNGTIQDAHDLGISTWSIEEIDSLINRWEARQE